MKVPLSENSSPLIVMDNVLRKVDPVFVYGGKVEY
jgi:hypothetical protein